MSADFNEHCERYFAGYMKYVFNGGVDMWNLDDLEIAGLYKEICENDETVRKKDLAERFMNVTHDLCKDKWTLLQILANINIVMSD